MKGFLCFMFLAMMVLFANQMTTAKEKVNQSLHQTIAELGDQCAVSYDMPSNGDMATITGIVYVMAENVCKYDFILPVIQLRSQSILYPTFRENPGLIGLYNTQYDPGWKFTI